LQDTQSGRGSAIVGLLCGLAAAIPGLNISLGPIRPVYALLVAALLVAMILNPRVPAYRPMFFDWAVVVVVATEIVTESLSVQELGHPAWFVLTTQLILYFVGYVAARLSVTDTATLRRFLAGFIATGPLFALVGVLQVLDVGGVQELVLNVTRSASAQGREERGVFARATAFVGHWTGFGNYLLVILAAALILAGLVHSRRARLWVNAVIVALLVGLLSTLTFSVVGTGMVLVGVGLVLSRRSATKWMALVLGAGAAVLVVPAVLADRLVEQYNNKGSFATSFGIVPESLVYRWQIWTEQLLPAIRARPVVGWGQGFYGDSDSWVRFPQTVTWNSAESQWMFQLLTGGAIGLVALLFLLVALRSTWARSERRTRGILDALLVLSILSAFTVPLFTNVGLPLPLFALAGALAYTRPPRVSPFAPEHGLT
jgi:O-Antigen ligase